MSANNEDLKKVTQRRRPHGPGARMMPGEKAKDFKGSIGKLVRFMGQFKAALVLAIIFAIGSAAFNIVGPKVLSKATTELFEGLVAKVGGTGGIDFDAIAGIIAATLVLYLVSAACSFVQGWMMTSVSQRTCSRAAPRHRREDRPHARWGTSSATPPATRSRASPTTWTRSAKA